MERSGLPKGTCAVELDLDAIPITEALPAPAVSPFPAVFQDVSLIVGEDVAAQSVVDAVRDGAGELLEDVRLFDVYTGPQIGDGRKSLTLALRFRAADRTLTEDEASAARDAAVATGRRTRRRRAAELTWPFISELTSDGLDAVVGKHAGVASDGGKFGVIAVGVNLEQVAAL